VTNTTLTNDYAAGTAFGTITIQDPGYTLSGNAIGLDGDLVATYATGSSTVSADLELQSTRGVDVTDGGTLSLSGAISGTGFGITKAGGGTLSYGGGSANTYNGPTAVNGGRLVLGKTSGVAIAGPLLIGDGSGADDVRLNGFDQIADTSGVTLASGGLLDLFGFDDAIGTLTMTGATVTTGVGTLTLGGDVTTNADASTSVISGHLDLGGATRTNTQRHDQIELIAS